MARATAICRCQTCGNEFKMIAYKRNRAECDSWEEWAAGTYTECDDCRQKRLDAERKAEAEEAAKAAAEIGLPVLTGTEKQVAWAERIRFNLVQKWTEWADNAREKGASQKALDNMKTVYDWIISKTDSSWWIDNRDDLESADWAYRHYRRKAKDDFEMTEIKAEEPKKPEPEIIEPENKSHETVCTVTITETAIIVKSTYNPAMPPIVKALGYKWDGRLWGKALSYRTEDPVDRAAEVANRLLTAGFPVIVPEEAKEKAITGNYIPEWQRWISWRVDKGQFEVSGDVRLTGLPGAKGRLVPLDSYDAVEEFARVHDYRLSPGAEQAIAERKARTVKVDVAKGASPEYKEEDVSQILKSSRDVLDDLKED